MQHRREDTREAEGLERGVVYERIKKKPTPSPEDRYEASAASDHVSEVAHL